MFNYAYSNYTDIKVIAPLKHYTVFVQNIIFYTYKLFQKYRNCYISVMK